MLRVTICIVCILIISSENAYIETGPPGHTSPSFKNSIQVAVERFNVGLYKFLLVSQTVSWYEANIICTIYNSTLAIIDNATVANEIVSIAKKRSIDFYEVWIGGRKIKDKWFWNTGSLVNNFNSSQVINDYDECLVLQNKREEVIWTGEECIVRKRFLCQKDIFLSIQLDLARPSPKIIYYDREFVFYTVPLTFPTAAAFCAFRGLKLAIIDDKEIAKKITQKMIINRPSVQKVWISGHFFDNTWRWLSTNEPIKNLNINSLRRIHQEYEKTCIYLQQELNDEPKFLMTQCDRQMSFLCETPLKTIQLRRMNKESRFAIVDEKLTWEEANKYCKRAGGQLAEANNIEAWQTIVNLVKDFPTENVALWLDGQNTNGTWIWKQSHKVVERKEELFHLCQCPSGVNNKCLSIELDVNGKPLLYGLPCDYKQVFVCSNI